jgi:DNA-binding response OmpR family regulator
MKRILLVEDDVSLGRTLTERLKQETYEVQWARSVKEATDVFKKEKKWDLVILDVGLPDGLGFDLAENFSKNSTVQFLFLTAQADAESRLRGFELGAQEYIPKPFHLKELLLRVSHIFESHESKNILHLSDCSVDFSEMSVKRKNGKIEYPALSEMKVLQFLFASSPKILSRDEIIDEVWGVDKNPSHRSVDNIILRLRQLLGVDGENKIRSVRGVGYQWLNE